MAPQQSSDFVASTSALIILLSAYNIDLLINNIQLSFLILLSSSMLFLVFRFFVNGQLTFARHSSLTPASAPNTTTVKKSPIHQSSPITALDTPSQAVDSLQAESKSHQQRVASTQPDKPTQWSLQLLQDMDWKHFENLCAHYYKSLGYIIKTAPAGDNKDVDIYLYKNTNPNKILGIIKCKKWKKRVGLPSVKALSTIQSNQKVPLAAFFSATGFSKNAISFCDNKHLKLISGEELLGQIKKLPLDIQKDLLKEAVQGEYTVPSCTKCYTKMSLHTNHTSNKQVWRCQQYTKCKTTLYLTNPRLDS